MKIDPEVAALLDDLPVSRLPQPLIDEGWGRNSLDQMGRVGVVPIRPSDVQAPTFNEACAQCGRPITLNRRGHWVDHVGRRVCDGAIVDGAAAVDHHITAADLVEHQRRAEWIEEWAKRPPPSKGSDCSARKHSHRCEHQCFHPDNHFGFHECIRCRHLWR